MRRRLPPTTGPMMALSGETIDSNYVLDRLLHFGAETRAPTAG